jgi:hypothetical protein
VIRILVAAIASALTLILATPTWLAVVRSTRPSIQTAWVEGLYERKIAAANNLRPGRIVIVGGSGVHYGYSAEEVTRITGLPTVNLGTHAGLGMPYLLYRAEQVLKPGDFAVLAIEPPINFPLPPTSVLSEFVVHYDLAYLQHTSFSDGLRIVYGVSPSDVVQEVARRLVPWTAEVGRPETVNGFGDESLDLSRLMTPAIRESVRSAAPMPAWSADPDKPPKPLSQFLTWAQAHNVRVGMAWTPMLRDPAYSTPRYQAFFAGLTQWYVRGGGLKLGDASEYFQPLDNMFDNILHDNERGRIAASRTLAAHLCEVLECPGADFRER